MQKIKIVKCKLTEFECSVILTCLKNDSYKEEHKKTLLPYVASIAAKVSAAITSKGDALNRQDLIEINFNEVEATLIRAAVVPTRNYLHNFLKDSDKPELDLEILNASKRIYNVARY